MEMESNLGNKKKTDDNTALFETAGYFVAYRGVGDGEKSAFGEDTDDKERRAAWN